MKWATIPLGSECNLVTKGTTPTTLGHSFSDSGVPFIRVQNLRSGRVDLSTDTLHIDQRVHTALKRSQIKSGDILLSIAGTIGRCAIVEPGLPEMNCNQAIAIIRLTEKLHRPFVRHWLESKSASQQVKASSVTGTISNLSLSQIERLQIPLPPLDEQRRIASILDKAEELRAKRRAAIALLGQLPQAIFLEMFGAPEGAKGSNELRIGDFCRTGSGGTPSRQAESKYYNGGTIPWVKSGELRESVIHKAEEYITPLALAESSAKIVSAGAILLAMYGATVGRLAILGTPAATNQAICNIVPEPTLADTTYVYHVLQQQVPSMISMAAGGAQPNISQNIIKSIPVALPPLDLQRHFAVRVEATHRAKAVHQSSLTQLDALFASIQNQAFSGHLPGREDFAS